MQEKKISFKGNIFPIQLIENIFITLDQTINTILLGDPMETLSSRLGRARMAGERYFWVKWLGNFVNFLFFMQKNHILESVREEIEHDRELWNWNKRNN